MKTLYIVRHAKSSWKDIAIDDFDRPLNKRGKEDAPLIGGKLQQSGICPDIILSSPAKRAKDTANIISEMLQCNQKVVFDNRIYDSNVITLKKIVRDLEDKYDSLMLFGHNPGLNMLVDDFCDFHKNIPTCGVVVLRFDCEQWKEVSRSNSEMIEFLYPKKYNLTQ